MKTKCALILLSSWLVAPHAAAQDLLVRPAVFSLAADYARDELLTDIRDRLLPDMTIPSEYGPVRLTGMRLSMSFDGLGLRPGSGALTGELSMSRITAYIPRMFIPYGRGLECTGTTVRVGHHYPLTASLEIFPDVRGGEFHHELRRLQFAIPVANYDTIGPADCGGLILGNEIARRLVAKTIANASTDLEAQIRAQALTFLGGVDAKVNAALHDGFDLPLPAAGFIPAGTLHLTPYLKDLRVAGEGLLLRTDTRFTRRPAQSPSGLSALTPLQGFTPTREIARLSAKPAQLNQLLGEVFKVSAPPSWATPDDNELVGALFYKDNFESALPELSEVPLDRDEFAIGLQIPAGAPPQVQGLAAGAARLVLPRVHVHLAFFSGGEQVEFFVLVLQGHLDFRAGRAAGKPTLELLDTSELHGSGAWAPGYTPTDRRIDQGELDAFAAGIVDGLQQTNLLESVALPAFAFRGHRLGIYGLELGLDAQTLVIGE